ncbi:MAG TPA: carboxymuconolactone decarboxylase family protein [Gemmatimonadaceae bacterium]|nr:carboxymuconolactone decarboxylase family protein [Gemmatimonadaceae bacterium]
MTAPERPGDSLPPLDNATVALVRLSACIAAGSEESVRGTLSECVAASVSEGWLEELMLQSYLFAGFPRALNAAREWRRMGGRTNRGAARPGDDSSYADVFDWRVRGQDTCATVYGANYDKLRANIRALHPLMDEWMIVEGYGKVLARPGLDLIRRELCIVAACAASGQDRQLHSHLLGARNAGAARAQVTAALQALEGVAGKLELYRAQSLWERVRSVG